MLLFHNFTNLCFRYEEGDGEEEMEGEEEEGGGKRGITRQVKHHFYHHHSLKTMTKLYTYFSLHF